MSRISPMYAKKDREWNFSDGGAASSSPSPAAAPAPAAARAATPRRGRTRETVAVERTAASAASPTAPAPKVALSAAAKAAAARPATAAAAATARCRSRRAARRSDGLAGRVARGRRDARLPALRETWLGGAAARCAAALVVSDAAVRCDEDGPCVASVAVDCAASHAGLPCKSARARGVARGAPRAVARADGATFRVALGGAGWALSGPAAALAAAHLDLYFSLASGMVRASDGGRDHIADDVFFGTFMAALGVGAAGPRGFTQAPVDARGGVPPCARRAAARESRARTTRTAATRSGTTTSAPSG
ncbi:hypothetical protein JL722_2616 [Aureococcus anophagefferens]|nr:hypothetical protein JL722_2616 [Aureococcus anophagefferens]